MFAVPFEFPRTSGKEGDVLPFRFYYKSRVVPAVRFASAGGLC